MEYKNEIQELFDSIKDYKVLDADTQRELVVKAQKGDDAAREMIILSNMRFVISYVSKYKRTSLPLSELVSEGTLGIIEAIDKYDPKEKSNFVSYAAWWIRHNVERYIHKSMNVVRLPMNKVRLLQRIRREEQQLLSNDVIDEREIIKKIALEINQSEMQVKELFQMSQESISLEQEIMTDGDITYLDGLEDSNQTPVYIQVEEDEMNSMLDSYMSKIPEREAYILKKRFGLAGAPQSLREVSTDLGITKERVRQLEKRGLERIKQFSDQEVYMEHMRTAA